MSRSVWIQGFEGKYKIYDDGRVESFWVTPPRFLKPAKNSRGYMALKLSNREASKSVKIHRLVAQHFVPGYRPELDVNHKNYNKLDNRAENLEWVTRRENNIHAISNGRVHYTRAVVGVHIKSGQTVEFSRCKDAAAFVKSNTGAICACCKGAQQTSKGYRWSYATKAGV